MSVATSTLEIVIAPEHIDSLGHVNNAAYVVMFERGRIHFYTELRLPLERDEPPRLGTVVVNLNVDFRAESFAGERLRLETRPGRLGNSSYTLQQRLVREDGAVVAEAAVTSVIMDLDSRRVVAMPDPLRDAFGAP